jgi:nitrate reductase gamma subunit
MAEWRQLITIVRLFHIGGLFSFLGFAIMILTGMTSIGAIEELLRLCPFCM